MKSQATLILLLLTILCCFQGKTQAIFNKKNYPAAAFYIKSDTSTFGKVQVVITMVHPKREEQAKFACRAWLTIIKGGKTIQQKYHDIEALGGCSGLYVPSKQPCKDFFILSKFGDYEGQTLLIDTAGKLTVLTGGSFSITNDGNFLLALFDSDVSGITIYDLKHRKTIVSAERNDELRYGDFYFQDGKYLVSFDTEENAKDLAVGTIDCKQGKITIAKKTKDYLKKTGKLAVYNEVKSLGKCNCGL